MMVATRAKRRGKRKDEMRSRSQQRLLCPQVEYAAGLVCKRWTTLIVEVLLVGPLRFNALLAQLGVISDRMLSERLKELEAAGVIARHVLPQTPVRVEYSLTRKGEALKPVLVALRAWGKKHTPPEWLAMAQQPRPRANPQAFVPAASTPSTGHGAPH
jgi:DNA-binding HxlR family transcriptional regulator